MPALKNAVPDASSHSLPKLYESQLGKIFAAHNAEADVRALSQLYHHTKADFLYTTVTWASVADEVAYERGKAARLSTLLPLVEGGGLSRGMAEKAAASGLGPNHLASAHQRDPAKGIVKLFMEFKGHGKRVTATKKIIDKVMAHFTATM